MKTKSGLNLSIPLGAIVWGIESALGSALLFLIATVGSVLAGIWAGVHPPEPRIWRVVYDGPEEIVLSYLGSFFFGLFTLGGFTLAICSLCAFLIFLKSCRWAADGLFALGVCCLLIGYRMGKEIEGDADLINQRLVLILIPLGVIYSLRWLPMVLSHRKRLSENDSSEIIFD